MCASSRSGVCAKKKTSLLKLPLPAILGVCSPPQFDHLPLSLGVGLKNAIYAVPTKHHTPWQGGRPPITANFSCDRRNSCRPRDRKEGLAEGKHPWCPLSLGALDQYRKVTAPPAPNTFPRWMYPSPLVLPVTMIGPSGRQPSFGLPSHCLALGLGKSQAAIARELH